MEGEFSSQWRPEPKPSYTLEDMMCAFRETELHPLIEHHPEVAAAAMLPSSSPCNR